MHTEVSLCLMLVVTINHPIVLMAVAVTRLGWRKFSEIYSIMRLMGGN
jgi:hypothetical protein